MCELTWFNKNALGEIKKVFIFTEIEFHLNSMCECVWNSGVFVQVWSKNSKFKHEKRTCMHYGN
jgi:hypothetical protein